MMQASGSSRLFDGVPGPSPWYLRSNPPIIEGFHWKPAGEEKIGSAITLLVGERGPVAVFSFYNYVQPLDSHALLIWNQSQSRNGNTPPVHFIVVNPGLLDPFGENLDEDYTEMNFLRLPLVLGSPPLLEFDLATTSVGQELPADFPRQLQGLEELMLFCNSSAIGPADGWSASNLALLIAKPRDSTYGLLPQDWFNHGSFDYGYQWATRVVRDPITRIVHGEGIRIGSFALDDSLRNLRKS